MSTPSNHDAEKATADRDNARLPEKLSVEIEVSEDTANKERYGQTQRGLKSRHIQLIALGGCIGTVSLRSVVLLNVIRTLILLILLYTSSRTTGPFVLMYLRDSSLAAEQRSQQADQLLCSCHSSLFRPLSGW